MSPKKSKAAKPSIKKAGTMVATTAAGEEYLKRSWGKARFNRYRAMDQERDALLAPLTKPKLSKTRTMQNTTNEAKELLGKEVLADTRQETKRRQAAEIAKTTRENAAKQKVGRKPALKRLGTMAKTATEGKAYVKRTGKKTTARKRTGGTAKNSAK
ncbi:unnamed protein product [Rotaria socialis]|uniref:Uncharacterized protein n=5 Tax=Rotaria socialis TaxID=392032 RepID=A0A820ALY7_9BILA|nr:unnamed protein product [Rotaria socialis]CAF3269458.1 unnamed protein product [Rotaria socialis]CAF3486814.1 unnamed protein product [Rotaria socialis]CAF3534204.1 unnamed protein product [Rotaria socialis]CAF3702905.1 unnamed protein product [Rotaria socialis]